MFSVKIFFFILVFSSSLLFAQDFTEQEKELLSQNNVSSIDAICFKMTDSNLDVSEIIYLKNQNVSLFNFCYFRGLDKNIKASKIAEFVNSGISEDTLFGYISVQPDITVKQIRFLLEHEISHNDLQSYRNVNKNISYDEIIMLKEKHIDPSVFSNLIENNITVDDAILLEKNNLTVSDFVKFRAVDAHITIDTSIRLQENNINPFVFSNLIENNMTIEEGISLLNNNLNILDFVIFREVDSHITVDKVVELNRCGLYSYLLSQYRIAQKDITIDHILQALKIYLYPDDIIKYKEVLGDITLDQMLLLKRKNISIYDLKSYIDLKRDITIDQILLLRFLNVRLFDLKEYIQYQKDITIDQIVYLVNNEILSSNFRMYHEFKEDISFDQIIELKKLNISSYDLISYRNSDKNITLDQILDSLKMNVKINDFIKYKKYSKDHDVNNFVFKKAVSNGDELLVNEMIEKQKTTIPFPYLISHKDSRGISAFDIVERKERLAKKKNDDFQPYLNIKNMFLENQRIPLEKLRNIIYKSNSKNLASKISGLKNSDVLSFLTDEEIDVLMSKLNPDHFHCFIASGAKVEAISFYDGANPKAFAKNVAFDLGKKIVPVGGGYCFVFDSWQRIMRHIQFLEDNSRILINDKMILAFAGHFGEGGCQVNNSSEKSTFEEVAESLIDYGAKYSVASVIHSCFSAGILDSIYSKNVSGQLSVIASSKECAPGTKKNPMRVLLDSKSGDLFADIYNKSYESSVLLHNNVFYKNDKDISLVDDFIIP